MLSSARDFVPREYHGMVLDHLLNTPRCALWAEMGLGKTVMSLSMIDALHLMGDDSPWLVLGPKRVAADVWSDEARKWRHLERLRVVPIIGSHNARWRALTTPADVHTINYENLPWLLDAMEGKGWRWPNVLADESTRLKSFRGSFQRSSKGKLFLRPGGGQRALALARIAHTQVKRFVELTGTPSPNGLIDLWGQSWFIDAGKRLGHTFSAFASRWFHTVTVDNVPTQYVPHPFAREQIEDRLRDVCLTLRAKDWFDLHEPIRVRVNVKLPVEARAGYTQMEREMFLELGGHEIEAVNAAAKTMKCLQIANGAIFTDKACTNWQKIHDAKIDALHDVVEEAAGMPVLVAYHFTHDRERLLKAFPRGVDLSTTRGLAAFKAGDAPQGFGHPASLGHGVDGMQYITNKIAFFGHWWDLELRDQIIERIGPVRQMQAGMDRPVFIYDICAEDTVDELALARHETKRSVQDLVKEAMVRKGFKR